MQITTEKNGEPKILQSKLCSLCNLEQDINSFYTLKNHKYLTHSPWCSSCCRERQRSRNRNIRKICQQYRYEYLLSHPCVDCGWSDIVVLEFHHLDPSRKSFSPSNTKHTLKAYLFELEKCIVLCANCHRKRTAVQKNWYVIKWLKEKFNE